MRVLYTRLHSSRSIFRLLALPWLLAMMAPLALAKAPYEISLPDLEARYADAASRFTTVDGVRVHYKDEGTGPIVVMVHASFLNLHSWDALAAELARTHRVVRLDLLSAGLTGPDPNGRYSIERNIELLEGLLQQLQITRYALIATSSGGIVAFRHAARRPEAVERLVLINSAGMPRSTATDPNRPRGSSLMRWIRAHYRSRGYWENNLQSQFTGGSQPAADFVTRTYDMNRRAGLVEEANIFLKNFRTGDPQAELAKVRAPTMIAWGMGNITVVHLEADVFQHWLTQAPSLIVKYPKLGHYLYVEEPVRVARDIEDFLQGKRDAELRVTQRVIPVCVSACTP